MVSAITVARPYYHLGSAQKEVYEQILLLKLNKAQELLDKLKEDESENMSVYHLENYIDFFKVFISETREDLEKFRTAKDYRLNKLDAIASSPYKLYAKAEIQLQWALARAKFGEEMKAAWDINKAYIWLSKNQKSYPYFELNKKSLSMIHALVGSISGIKKTLIKVFTSLDGSVSQGITEIKELYQSDLDQSTFFSPEIISIRALTALHIESSAESAYGIIKDKRLDKIESSPLIAFLRGSIAKHSGNSSAAIKHLDRPYSEEQLHLAYNDLILGNLLLSRLDDRALVYLTRFVDHHRGRHYLKEAYQKIAWYHLVFRKDYSAYKLSISKCLMVGCAELGEDEEAQKEALSARIPNDQLLKSRLLYDGGSYRESLTILNNMDTDELSVTEISEWHYRMGRVQQALKNDQAALAEFLIVLNTKGSDGLYMRCNAALQSGIILFSQERLVDAERMFQLALTIKPEIHGKSLQQKSLMWIQKISETTTRG